MPGVLRRGPRHLNSHVSKHSEVPIRKMGVISLDRSVCVRLLIVCFSHCM